MREPTGDAAAQKAAVAGNTVGLAEEPVAYAVLDLLAALPASERAGLVAHLRTIVAMPDSKRRLLLALFNDQPLAQEGGSQ